MRRNPNRADRAGAIDWEKQRRFDVEFAKQMLLETGEVRPMFVIHTAAFTKLFLALWDSPEQKRMTQRLIMLRAAVDNAEGVTFIGEAWVRNVEKAMNETEAEHRARALEIPPADAEDRMEVVIVTTEYRTADGPQSHCTLLDIVRDAAGKPVAAPQHGDVSATSVGAIPMLTSRPLTDDERVDAERVYNLLAAAAGFQTNNVRTVHPAGHA